MLPSRSRENIATVVPYFLLFAYFAFGSLVNARGAERQSGQASLAFVFGMMMIAFMIGFRYRVGTDWNSYIEMFRAASYLTLFRQFNLGDPGYQFLNWAVYRLGGEFWLVNLLCGSIFAYGLWRLAREQPEPWLAAVVAIPYLTLVVAMGYSRQGVAIGILLAGLAAVSRDRSFIKFVVYVGAATMFHSSALLVLPVALFGADRSKVLNVALIALFGAAFYFSFVAANVDRYMVEYVENKYDSQGALIRVVMCVVPALIFFAGGKRMGFSEFEHGLWRNFSVAALLLLVALYLARSSTAVDRLALYVLPLQIAVLSRLPRMLGASIIPRLMVIAYMAMVMAVWLNFATHAVNWIPYRSYLWD